MMGRCACLVLTVCFIGLQVFGQTYFSRIYEGFRLNSGTITPDSGLVLSGGGSLIYGGRSLLRVDRDGTPLWTTSYTTVIGDPVWIHDVAWLGDSSYILVGSAGPEWTPLNVMVQQVVGSTGEVSWGGRLTGTGYPEDRSDWLRRAERTTDGSVIVCGARRIMNLAGVYGPGYVVRIGVEEGSYSTPFVSNAGGGDVSVIQDVASTGDGGFVSVGIADNHTIAVKVSASGTVVWARRVYYVGTDDLWMHTVEGEEGSTYIAAQAFSGTFRLIQLDSTGTVSWTRKYQMPGDDRPTGFVRFPNGDLWISGTGWLMACSSMGDVLWAREVPHTIVDMEGALEADGVFLVGRDGNDGWLMRTDITGQVPGCPEMSFVPTVTSETLVTQSYSGVSSAYGLSGYEAGGSLGQVPATQMDCLVTGVQPLGTSGQSLRAYPVPFTHQLNLDLPESHDRVELIDAQGAMQRSLRTSNERSIILNRGDLVPGLYLLRVMDAHVQVGVQRVIVE